MMKFSLTKPATGVVAVAEGANMPTTPEAVKVPDTLHSINRTPSPYT